MEGLEGTWVWPTIRSLFCGVITAGKSGEHGSWCKQTNYDIDLQVPLMIHVPGQPNAGFKTKAIVELVDLYPTVCDAANLPIPEIMEGSSMMPLLADPNKKWKTAAFSQFHRAPNITPDKGRYMGSSLMTERYHYVEWRTWDHIKGIAGELKAVELYDLQSDPQENVNIAADPQESSRDRKVGRRIKSWLEVSSA